MLWHYHLPMFWRNCMIPGNAIPDIIRQAIFGCVSDPLTQKTVNKNHMRHQLTPPAAATDAPDPIASQDVNDLPRIGLWISRLDMFFGMPRCWTNLSVAKTGRGVSSFRGATRYLFSSVLIWSQIHIFQDLNRCFSAVQSKNTSEAMNSDDLWGFRLWKSAFYNISSLGSSSSSWILGMERLTLHLLTCEGLLLAKILFFCLSSSTASQ